MNAFVAERAHADQRRNPGQSGETEEAAVDTRSIRINVASSMQAQTNGNTAISRRRSPGRRQIAVRVLIHGEETLAEARKQKTRLKYAPKRPTTHRLTHRLTRLRHCPRYPTKRRPCYTAEQ